LLFGFSEPIIIEMKTHLLSAFVLCLFASFANAQILEGGFDNWTPAGSCDEPAGWNTVNGTTAILSLCTAEQETSNPYAGSAAIKITSEFRFLAGQVIPGIVSNGNINIQNQSVTGGVSFTERPTAFAGWYRAAPENGDTYSLIAVLINEVTGDSVGVAIFEGTSAVINWTQFTQPVQYLNQQTPTLLQITMFASDPLDPQDGSTVYFDELDYESLTVGIEDYDQAGVNAYPNPVIDDVFFNLGTNELATVNIYNILGTSVLQQTVSKGQNSVSLRSISNGTYIWQLTTRQGEPIKTGKLIKTN
jgi:hypothetical protein